jgi:hypothetical protein
MSTTLDVENIARLAVILSRYTKQTQRAHLDAIALAKISRQLHTLAEKQCNVGLSQRDDARRVSLDRKVLRILYDGGYAIREAYPGAATSDIAYAVQGDLRGYCLRLKFPGGEFNTLGGDYGV